jgi:hypothetical protein
MSAYSDNNLRLPQFISLSNVADLIGIASANFYRTITNTNIQIFIPVGTIINGLGMSPDVYLPNMLFNAKKETNAIKYPNNKDVLVLREVTCLHNISLQLKINKADGSNFANQREVRITLVNSTGDVYDQSIFANYQPDTGQHISISLVASIIHTIGDIIKIKINLVQDNKLLDQSDTELTIFNISWNIDILKNF